MNPGGESVTAAPAAQVVEIAGKAYVLLPKVDYERLRSKAEGFGSDLSSFGAIGPEIRQRRRRARLTLAEVARRAGIRLETLSRIENGRTNPTLGTVQAVLRALEEGA